ncbi:hypothetical protein SDC9_140469 [bioreactor metagenome]|uniref:Uncharacterized protein n=1 Tax=bioreactor metagenome TaxID=1076179 RepID=A0A645DYC3_9ZZZZ
MRTYFNDFSYRCSRYAAHFHSVGFDAVHIGHIIGYRVVPIHTRLNNNAFFGWNGVFLFFNSCKTNFVFGSRFGFDFCYLRTYFNDFSYRCSRGAAHFHSVGFDAVHIGYVISNGLVTFHACLHNCGFSCRNLIILFGNRLVCHHVFFRSNGTGSYFNRRDGIFRDPAQYFAIQRNLCPRHAVISHLLFCDFHGLAYIIRT